MTVLESRVLYAAPAMLFLTALACFASDAVSSDRGTTPDKTQMETWWADLEKQEPDASRALLDFSAKPEAAVSFLKSKMQPLKIGANAVRALIAKLASEEEAVWKPAFEELDYFDPRLAIDLQTLMTEVTDPTARQHMVELLSGRPAGSLKGKELSLRSVGPEGFNFFDGRGSWWAEHQVARINSVSWGRVKSKWTRAVRAIVLLDHIGTAESLAIVNEMANGHPDAEPTKVAKQVLVASKPGSR
jgi:hypothetical protein